MSDKTKKFINGILAGLVAFIFTGSAISKFAANEEALKMASTFGLDSTANYTLGIVELAGVILFAIPRTGIIGTLLLAAYMGGAIATHLEHGQSVIAPCAIQAFLWIAAFVRFPELSKRILGKAN